MSFILDALKKSEAERARQSGPALLEMRIVPPKRRTTAWIIVLGALLSINLGVLLWFALRHEPAAAPTTTRHDTAAAVSATASSAAPVLAAPAPTAAPAIPSVPAAGRDAEDRPPDTGALPPRRAFVADPGARVAGAAEGDDATAVNPADLEPATNPPAGVRTGRAGGERPNYGGITGAAPELRLDLHVYATRPQDRYALINMHTVHEGDVLPEGPRVVEITRDGVVLDWHGREFLLGRE